MAGSSSPGSYSPPPRVVLVVSGWPRLSETFAQHEIAALRHAGMLVGVVATKAGDHALVQPGLEELTPMVAYLPEGDVAAQVDALVDHVRGLGHVDALHGYFAHRPSEVAAAAAQRLGVPYGMSVHALDVRKVEPDDLRQRGNGAAVVVTCNTDALATLTATGVAATVVPHGVDLDRFRPAAASDRPTAAVHVLAVGRLVEKKGFATLIDAMVHLGDLPIELTIVGDGPARGALEARIAARGVGGRVHLAGRATHGELPARYRAADVVVVPSVVDANGDRDGLPNVVLEAMASGCAIVASDVAAIASAVIDDGAQPAAGNGVLVPPGDALALAIAVRELVADPARRMRLGSAARRTAEQRFALDRCGERFCNELARAFSTVPSGGVR